MVKVLPVMKNSFIASRQDLIFEEFKSVFFYLGWQFRIAEIIISSLSWLSYCTFNGELLWLMKYQEQPFQNSLKHVILKDDHMYFSIHSLHVFEFVIMKNVLVNHIFSFQ